MSKLWQCFPQIERFSLSFPHCVLEPKFAKVCFMCEGEEDQFSINNAN